MNEGVVAELSRLKRLDARARQKLAADRLSAFEIQANEKSYHLWLTLPAYWRSQTFCRGRGQARHRVDAVHDLRRHAGLCPERRQAGVGSSGNGSAQYRPAYPGRHAQRQ